MQSRQKAPEDYEATTPAKGDAWEKRALRMDSRARTMLEVGACYLLLLNCHRSHCSTTFASGGV